MESNSNQNPSNNVKRKDFSPDEIKEVTEMLKKRNEAELRSLARGTVIHNNKKHETNMARMIAELPPLPETQSIQDANRNERIDKLPVAPSGPTKLVRSNSPISSPPHTPFVPSESAKISSRVKQRTFNR